MATEGRGQLQLDAKPVEEHLPGDGGFWASFRLLTVPERRTAHRLRRRAIGWAEMTEEERQACAAGTPVPIADEEAYDEYELFVLEHSLVEFRLPGPDADSAIASAPDDPGFNRRAWQSADEGLESWLIECAKARNNVLPEQQEALEELKGNLPSSQPPTGEETTTPTDGCEPTTPSSGS